MSKTQTVDREKYLQIFKAQGLSAALTALHIDQERAEFETFEGEAGWQPEMFKGLLEEYHTFSRELWDLVLDPKYNEATEKIER